MKPFLRWAGSKKKLLPDLLKYWAECSVQKYVEPFMGSASLFFALQPKAAVLGDTNKELVKTFEAVRDDPVAVHNFLKPLRVNKKTYYDVRDSWNDSDELAKTAARFDAALRKLPESGAFTAPLVASRTLFGRAA